MKTFTLDHTVYKKEIEKKNWNGETKISTVKKNGSPVARKLTTAGQMFIFVESTNSNTSVKMNVYGLGCCLALGQHPMKLDLKKHHHRSLRMVSSIRILTSMILVASSIISFGAKSNFSENILLSMLLKEEHTKACLTI